MTYQMDVLFIFEIISAICAVLGAYLVGGKTHLVRAYSFLSFLTSNVFMIIVSLDKGILPLLFQMLVFSLLALVGLNNVVLEMKRCNEDNLLVSLSRSLNHNIKSKTIYVSFISLISVLFVVNFSNMDFNAYYTYLSSNTIEIIAVCLALFGSSLINNLSVQTKVIGLFLFLLADVLYIYIALSHSLYPFFIQSIIFIGTSSLAMKSFNEILKEENSSVFTVLKNKLSYGA